MSHTWIEAGGQYQFEFMGAGSRIVNGDYEITCPKCGSAILRFYFHVFNRSSDTGTMWVWCQACYTFGHLPRVSPKNNRFRDPFGNLDVEEFAQLELDETTGFLDRLNRLWETGEIGWPVSNDPKTEG